MADGLNKVMLLGNLGQDPELKMIAGGQAVLNLRLATTETYLDKNNTRQERTDWHTVTVWGKRAEALAKFLTKGSQLFIEGRIQTRSYEKNGEKRYATDIVANNIILTGRRGGDSREAGEGGGGGGGERSAVRRWRWRRRPEAVLRSREAPQPGCWLAVTAAAGQTRRSKTSRAIRAGTTRSRFWLRSSPFHALFTPRSGRANARFPGHSRPFSCSRIRLRDGRTAH